MHYELSMIVREKKCQWHFIENVLKDALGPWKLLLNTPLRTWAVVIDQTILRNSVSHKKISHIILDLFLSGEVTLCFDLREQK
jgi:hypothetical protein